MVALAMAPAAVASFPYTDGSGTSFDSFHTNAGSIPGDLSGDGNDWKFAATPENPNPYPNNAKELDGVRGAHLVDPDAGVHTAWMTTTGRPDVAIAVLDSGIKWNDAGAMADLRFKVRLNRGELPPPEVTGPPRDSAVASCAGFSTAGSDPYDVNDDGVFNLRDYECDPRVSVTDSRRAGPAATLTPQDVIIRFSDGSDDDHNGYTDDIAGWDFLDNDNDPFDDVQYGHGTGEARDSSSEANNGGQSGSCPNCTVVPLRVGDSFVADVNNFGQAALYAVDNDVSVIQEALGTLNMSALGRRAIDYAYEHGVTVMASAADEAAQHHNWPSTYGKVIVVNSVVKYDSTFTPAQKSYLDFNGCTNFMSKITISIPSSSCSSNAVGLAAGMAGLVYSAALNAHENGRLSSSPDSGCRRIGGAHCLVTPNEVRQLMASGRIDPGNADAGNPHDTEDQADDVNFINGTEPGCGTVAAPACTDPNRFFPVANNPATGREVFSITGPATRSYPAHKGFDQYYGYGRVNMVKAVEATDAGRIPPEAEITGPDWYQQIDPSQPNLDVRGFVNARGNAYKCTVEVAPGSDPTDGSTPSGDFTQVASGFCDGSTSHSDEFDGVLAQINLTDLKSRFPSGTDFGGPAPTAASNVGGDGLPHFNNRPAQEPYGFTVRVSVTSVQGGKTLTGRDRRNLFLHRDQSLRDGFPKRFPSDGASSPALADVDGDNRNEVVFGTSDGRVHALRADGSELPGFPVHTDPLPLHTGQHAFTSGEVPEDTSYGAILASTAVGDIDHDGSPEIVAADMEGKIYVWSAKGDLEWKRESNPAWSGKPLQQFENVRCGVRCRTQHGFIASPVLANLDGSPDGKLDVIAAGMDRHVYAWKANGDGVAGFPVLVVDRDKITGVDPQTHVPQFRTDIGDALNQGAIVDTPAVGDLDGDGKLEIVVGTNEEYPADDDGGLNAGLSSGTIAALGTAGSAAGLNPVNSRLFAIKPGGDPAPGNGVSTTNGAVFVTGWPKKMGILLAELLPVVGEGVTGSPVIANLTCPSGGDGTKVGAIPDAGPGYLFNADGTSCYGQAAGLDSQQHDKTLSSDGQGFSSTGPKYDTPLLPAVGHPAFGKLDPTGSTVSFVAPAAGILRALDLAFPEYQGGQDFLSVWNGATGEFSPGFPSVVNDLQFLTGPSVADVDGSPGQEVIGGSASLDLNAVDATAQPVAGFPKLSSDWMVANPAIGSFGTLDTDSGAHNSLIAMTRAGTLFAYDTPAPACPLGSWPRFHHDNANSGVLERDAVSPGKPFDTSASATQLTFKAPGDDLLCGKADHYEAVTSGSPIAPDFSGATPIANPPAPADPGTAQTLTIPASAGRYVALRAIDDQGNAGRAVTVDRGPGAGTVGPGGSPSGGGGEPQCKDRKRPRTSVTRKGIKASRHGLRARGRSRDSGCKGSRVKRVDVSVARLVRGHRCRFLSKRGRLTRARKCGRGITLHPRKLGSWTLTMHGAHLSRGLYLLSVRAVDSAGNRERGSKTNRVRFRIR